MSVRLFFLTLLFSLSVTAHAYLSAGADSPYYDAGPYDTKPTYNTTPGEDTANYHYGYGPTPDGYVLEVDAAARAEYGDLGVSVYYDNNSYELSYNGTGQSQLSAASATSDDEITINSPGVAAGTKGTLFINEFLEGTVTGLDPADVLPELVFLLESTTLSTNNDVDGVALEAYGPGDYAAAGIPFVFGTPFELHTTIYADIDIENRTFDSSEPHVYGSVQFLNSAIWDSDTIQDANGNEVIGASITGSSRAVYPVSGVSAPEPAALSLLLLGLVGLVVALRVRLLPA